MTDRGGHLYTGRFAPSPTGPLHAGSLVAALASWLDARAHGGRWLVRIEDVDSPRCVPGADAALLNQLAACGLTPDETPVWQSQRGALYGAALQQLVERGLAYPCGCTRQQIAQALHSLGRPPQRHGELIYPGTCRNGLHGQPARAWRFFTGQPGKFTRKSLETQSIRAQAAIDCIATAGFKRPPDYAGPACVGQASDADDAGHAGQTRWHDRWLGAQSQCIEQVVGDFVLRRADGVWAYQLAVVVDDAAQGVTHVVRGEDLADNTARQISLQRALGLSTPIYLHTPLVRAANGEKLSKQNGAKALATDLPVALLQQAGAVLGLPHMSAPRVGAWLQQAVPLWAARQGLPPG
ncbi:MAG: tRNA glutamyl-Q(34) synthetase GluQRS [Polaromonas sp.]|nr:tRNA glutamyl-Q(34) synthetase GluQRS [Polaromonas sp.]